MPHRHRQERSEKTGSGADPRFRAVCACGWKSHELRPMQVHQAWEGHVEQARREAAARQTTQDEATG